MDAPDAAVELRIQLAGRPARICHVGGPSKVSCSILSSSRSSTGCKSGHGGAQPEKRRACASVGGRQRRSVHGCSPSAGHSPSHGIMWCDRSPGRSQSLSTSRSTEALSSHQSACGGGGAAEVFAVSQSPRPTALAAPCSHRTPFECGGSTSRVSVPASVRHPISTAAFVQGGVALCTMVQLRRSTGPPATTSTRLSQATGTCALRNGLAWGADRSRCGARPQGSLGGLAPARPARSASHRTNLVNAASGERGHACVAVRGRRG